MPETRETELRRRLGAQDFLIEVIVANMLRCATEDERATFVADLEHAGAHTAPTYIANLADRAVERARLMSDGS